MNETQDGQGMTGRLLERLGAPVDIASLVFFRVCFGLILHWEIWRFFLKDRIPAIYISPGFHFQYLGFGWVEPLPGNGMYVVFALLAVFAAGIALGFFYRMSCVLFGLGFLYVFLIEETQYLNHHYLVILLCFLMALVPAHRSLSVDAWWSEKLRSDTAPAWGLWLIRIQIGIVYFYAGLAKLKGDWLAGRPTVFMWSRAALEREWLQFFDAEFMAYFLSYGGLLLDLFVVPLLLWKRTRGFAFAGAVFFHISNKLLFQIGIFPYLMTAATTLYFDSDWPRRLIRRFRPDVQRGKQPAPAATSRPAGRTEPLRPVLAVLLGIYLLLQLTIPLRHYAYPGSVLWTEEGQYFAWHMLLRAKDVKAAYWVVDRETEQGFEVNPSKFLPLWQAARFATRPDQVVQFAQYLETELKDLGYKNFAIYADVQVSLNGRDLEPLIDPETDLTQAKRTLLPRDYIMPQEKPLPPMEEALELIEDHLGPESVE